MSLSSLGRISWSRVWMACCNTLLSARFLPFKNSSVLLALMKASLMPPKTMVGLDWITKLFISTENAAFT